MSGVDTSPLVTSIERYLARSRCFEVHTPELTRLQHNERLHACLGVTEGSG
jgi:hypothetical protein